MGRNLTKNADLMKYENPQCFKSHLTNTNANTNTKTNFSPYKYRRRYLASPHFLKQASGPMSLGSTPGCDYDNYDHRHQ